MFESGISWSNIISFGIGVGITGIAWFIRTVVSAKISSSITNSSDLKKDQINADRNLYSEFIKEYPTQRIEAILTSWHNAICKEEEFELIKSIKQVWSLQDKRFHSKKIQKKLELVIANSDILFNVTLNIVEPHLIRFDLYVIPYLRKITKPELYHQQLSDIRKHIVDFHNSYNDFIYVTRDTLKC